MTGSEKILAVIMSILVVLLVIMSVKYIRVNDSIGEKETYLNSVHQQRIDAYETKITFLNAKLRILQSQRDSIANEKAKIHTVFIHEVDSISHLPYDEQCQFIANCLSLLDSIRN